MNEQRPSLPCWLVYPEFFRGAVQLIHSAARWGSRDLDQTHRPMSIAALTTPCVSPGPRACKVQYPDNRNAADVPR